MRAGAAFFVGQQAAAATLAAGGGGAAGLPSTTKPKRAVRICNIATLVSVTTNSPMASLHRLAIAMLLLSALSSPSFAFGPAVRRRSFAVSNGIHIMGSPHRRSPFMHASEDDDVNGSSQGSINEDEEDHDEADIITQKLRRNAANVINPIKEAEKMIEENEAEAKNSGINGGQNSTTDAASALYSYMLSKAVDPDFDPDISNDEAYVESQFKELLSRKGDELTRLGHGIATLPLDPSSDEAKSENKLAKMESELEQVIDEAKASGNQEWDDVSDLEDSRKKQSDILDKAHKLQTEIDQLHVDDCGAVLLANLGFYEAFSLQDIEGMKDVWWQSPSVICIHPSHAPLIGSNSVYESFATMFEKGRKGRVRGSGNSAACYMTPTNIRGLSVRGTTASLVCDEEVYSKGSAGESIGQLDGELVNKLLTTNVFRKIGGKWKMVHRHASWHPETAAAQEAMAAEPGILLYDERDDEKLENSMTNRLRKAKGMTLKKLNGEGTSRRPGSPSSIPSSLDGLDANAVLGIPTPKEEETEKPKDGADGMIGKVINLSDLLGGSDSSSGDDSKGIGDALADIFKGSAESDSTHTTGSGTPEDPFITRRVIKIGPEGIENLGKNTKKMSKSEEGDEEDEEENVVIDLRGKSDEEQKAEIAKLVGKVMSDATDEVLKDAAIAADANMDAPVPDDKESLRQKCIATLRKLSDDGQLSPSQKRVLLTDIITSSARGETSMVEVAYDLLCVGEGGDSDTETGMEDFTEQCRVFASMGDE